MVRFLFLAMILLSVQNAVSQNTDSLDVEMITFIEEAPVYSGSLKKFIQSELVYPLEALKDSIEGTIVISFEIDTVGKTIRHKVVKGIHPDLNTEAIRIGKQIKFDKPALQKGKPIVVKYTIPVLFELRQKEQPSKK